MCNDLVMEYVALVISVLALGVALWQTIVAHLQRKDTARQFEISLKDAEATRFVAEEANRIAKEANENAESANQIAEHNLSVASDKRIVEWLVQSDDAGRPVGVLNSSAQSLYDVTVFVLLNDGKNLAFPSGHIEPGSLARVNLSEAWHEHVSKVMAQSERTARGSTIRIGSGGSKGAVFEAKFLISYVTDRGVNGSSSLEYRVRNARKNGEFIRTKVRKID